MFVYYVVQYAQERNLARGRERSIYKNRICIFITNPTNTNLQQLSAFVN